MTHLARSRPSRPRPADSHPVSPHPARSRPACSSPVRSGPAGSHPAGPRPVGSRSACSRSACSWPVRSRSACSCPVRASRVAIRVMGTGSECPNAFAGRPGPDRHRRPRWKSHPSRQSQDSLKISLARAYLLYGCDTLTIRIITVPHPLGKRGRGRGTGGLSGAQVGRVTSAGARTRDGVADGTGSSHHWASLKAHDHESRP
jgi:hypothetical protein